MLCWRGFPLGSLLYSARFPARLGARQQCLAGHARSKPTLIWCETQELTVRQGTCKSAAFGDVQTLRQQDLLSGFCVLDGRRNLMTSCLVCAACVVNTVPLCLGSRLFVIEGMRQVLVMLRSQSRAHVCAVHGSSQVCVRAIRSQSFSRLCALLTLTANVGTWLS